MISANGGGGIAQHYEGGAQSCKSVFRGARRRLICCVTAIQEGEPSEFQPGAAVGLLRQCYAIVADAYESFLLDDGWAIASHIALSTLMSLFPFLIFITALTGFLGTQQIADQVAGLLLEVWPKEVAGPISVEITNVVTSVHTGLLTVGVLLAIYFSSSGIESLRIGLNRAYGETEMRPWWLLRIESIGYVIIGAAGLIALAFLIVLGPFLVRTTIRYAPLLEPIEGTLTFWRFAIAITVLVVALVVAHKWLPAGRRRLVEIAPGIIFTLVMWLFLGIAFGRYLAEFAGTYVSTYAGLASAMVALVFLYWTAAIFVYGGELNHAIWKARKKPEP